MIGKVFAQENDSTQVLFPTKNDSVISVPLAANSVVVVQGDSSVTTKGTSDGTNKGLNTSFKPNPRTAVWLAVIPGMGQIYNRKYWKLPLVYGGFAGLAYGLNWNGRYYSDYRQAYSDFIDESPDTDSWIAMLPANQDPETVNAGQFSNSLRSKKDYYRRNRDLCIIGMAGLYVLTIVDAFVDAQLFDFDISPNLTLNVEPSLQPMLNRDLAVALQCRLNF